MNRLPLISLICILLALSTFLVYFQVLNHEFVDFDDNIYVIDNKHIKAGFNPKSITWAFTTSYASNWHPLTWLSHMLDYRLFGLNPRGHHLTNLIFHMVNSILLFILFMRMTNALWHSAFIAALFALHPLHVESVAWVAERKDLLCAFFWVLTLLFYINYSKAPSLKRYIIVFLLYLLGLMSKPMILTLPFLLLLLDYWPLGKFRRVGSTGNSSHTLSIFKIQGYSQIPFLPILLEKIPFIFLSIFSSIVTYFAQKQGGAVSPFDLLPLKVRIYNALVSYISYIGKIFWPQKLAAFYPLPVHLPTWKVLVAGLLLSLISLLVVLLLRRLPYLAVGWFWYMGTLLPVIGLVQVGNQAMADRYTYIPIIGLFIVITWSISDLSQKLLNRKVLLGLLAAVLFPVLMALTWFQVSVWKNSMTLFKHMAHVTENNYLAYDAIGLVLYGKGETDKAMANYIKALRVKPGYVNSMNNLANVFVKRKRFDEAITYYSRALEIKPDFSEAHINLGIALAEMGKLKEAIPHYHEAIRIQPDNAVAYFNLALDLRKLGQHEKAILYFKEAVKNKPDYSDANANLAEALFEMARFDEAIYYFYKALEIKPNDANAHYNLGVAFDRQGKLNEAINHYREALRLNPEFTMAKKNLEEILKNNKNGVTKTDK